MMQNKTELEYITYQSNLTDFEPFAWKHESNQQLFYVSLDNKCVHR